MARLIDDHFDCRVFDLACGEEYERLVVLQLQKFPISEAARHSALRSETALSELIRGSEEFYSKYRSDNTFGVNWHWHGTSAPSLNEAIKLGMEAGRVAFKEENVRVDAGVVLKYRRLKANCFHMLNIRANTHAVEVMPNLKGKSAAPLY